MKQFDFVVIGAGPGGMEAALRARELGLKTAIIEKKEPGGTCLNIGCVPTKSLLASAHYYSRLGRMPSPYPLPQGEGKGEEMYSDWNHRKNEVVKKLREAAVKQIEKSGIEWIQGEAKFTSKNEVYAGGEKVQAKNFLIATGAEPVSLPGLSFDGKKIISSDDVLGLESLPKNILIVGGGAIGVEFASVFHAAGVQVTIVEMMSQLLPGEDGDCAKRLENLFARKGVKVLTGTKLEKYDAGSNKAGLNNGETLSPDQILVSVGRRPVTNNLGLEAAGVQTEKGAIKVNEYLETNVPGIFAVGDVTGTMLLAHVASYQGHLVAENLAGKKKTKADYKAVPRCVYSDPEVAGVGMNQIQAASHGEEAMEVKIPFAAVSKSQVEGETDGFFKLTVASKTGKILGASAIGDRVTELLPEIVLAIRLGLTAEDLAVTIHAHPTQSEVISMAAKELCKKQQAVPPVRAAR